VIVVDAPVSFGDRLLEAIRLVSTKPITHVVYSHAHVDHTGGAYRLPSSATFVAHEETRFLLRRARATPAGRCPRSRSRAVGGTPSPSAGRCCTWTYHGPNHQAGELFIYAPKAKALMHVDLVFPGWAPLKNLAIASDVPGFVQALDTTLTYDFDHLVAGHFRLGTRDDVKLTRAYMTDLIQAAAEANNTVDTAAVEAAAMEQNPGNVWAAVDANFDAVARRTAELMPDRWLNELGAADCLPARQRFRGQREPARGRGPADRLAPAEGLARYPQLTARVRPEPPARSLSSELGVCRQPSLGLAGIRERALRVRASARARRTLLGAPQRGGAPLVVDVCPGPAPCRQPWSQLVIPALEGLAAVRVSAVIRLRSNSTAKGRSWASAASTCALMPSTAAPVARP
jgi:glyoxylase-like metal-dependent hydrolase (beta-lactamase superfamily II)